jgi:demethylmenaquinone methyltransferase/2-methoxy-6-polyprenyl-1,4-benzoquinol methylase
MLFPSSKSPFLSNFIQRINHTPTVVKRDKAMLEPEVGVGYRKRMERYRGIRNIPAEEYIRMVKDIFSTVTSRYDFLTHLLSLWRDISWRRFAAKNIRQGETCRLLDVGTGTADLAIEMALRNPRCSVAAMDFMAEMMELGAGKIKKKGLLGRVSLVRGDALDMPFPSGTFDAASIAFGIRNIPDKNKALREMGRVVAPGGRVLVLEMTRPAPGFFGRLYALYLKRILPQAARVFSSNPAAYRYLADSIFNFPDPSDFSDMMRRAGFSSVESYSLTLGITHLFVGSIQAQSARPKVQRTVSSMQ